MPTSTTQWLAQCHDLGTTHRHHQQHGLYLATQQDTPLIKARCDCPVNILLARGIIEPNHASALEQFVSDFHHGVMCHHAHTVQHYEQHPRSSQPFEMSPSQEQAYRRYKATCQHVGADCRMLEAIAISQPASILQNLSTWLRARQPLRRVLSKLVDYYSKGL